MVVANISNVSDDLRGTGYYVIARLRTASGTLLATSAKTDQWYSNSTVTFSFACSNVYLSSGTTYQLEFYESTGTTELVLFCKSPSSLYADGNVIEDGVSRPNADLTKWQINFSNVNLATTTSTQSQNVSSCGLFNNAASELIAFVQPGTTNGISGTTTAKVWIDATQSAQFVKRHYEITPVLNAATATARVTLYFTQAEFDAFNTVNTIKLPTGSTDATGIANLLIEKRNGTSSTGTPTSYTGTSQTINPADGDIVWNSAAQRWEVAFNVSGFSGFFVKTQATPLPITLVSFTVQEREQKAVLNWATSLEINAAHFEVEKSSDARRFTRIAVVPLSQQPGSPKSYTYLDDLNQASGIVYYRLKLVDQDGSFAYSQIVALGFVSRGSVFQVAAFPNPFMKQLQLRRLSGQEEEAFVRIISSTGMLLWQQQIRFRDGIATVECDLSAGVYLLQVQTPSTSVVLKLLKQ